MGFNYKGDWKFLLIVGGVLLTILLLVGAILSSVLSLFVWIFRGIGILLGTLVGFAFHSIFNLLIVVGIAYLLYRGYVYLKSEGSDTSNSNRIDYSDEDFDRREDNHEWK